MTVKAWRKLAAAFHAGLRRIQGGSSFARLAAQSQTDLTTHAALAIAPLTAIVATRRLGLLRRVLASGCPWLLGLILEAQPTRRLCGARFIQDSIRLESCEPGENLPLYDFFAPALTCPAPKWKARLKTATQAEIMARATEEDLAQL